MRQRGWDKNYFVPSLFVVFYTEDISCDIFYLLSIFFVHTFDRKRIITILHTKNNINTPL